MRDSHPVDPLHSVVDEPCDSVTDKTDDRCSHISEHSRLTPITSTEGTYMGSANESIKL